MVYVKIINIVYLKKIVALSETIYPKFQKKEKEKRILLQLKFYYPVFLEFFIKKV
jgi:hypothetical protein